MEKFIKDFITFTEKIRSKENFAYTRYADGEVMLMKGIGVGKRTQAHDVDKWSSPNTLTKVGVELLESLNHTESNYYYAIASDSISDYDFLINRIFVSKENITFSNLWINKNYESMKKFYESLDKDVILICNHKSEKENFPFKVNKIFRFPDDCVNFWESEGDLFMSNLINEVSSIKNKTFFISCGPVSEIIIHNLYNSNNENQYIDVGSSLDEYIHGWKTRPYMDENSHYSKLISTFPPKFYD